MINGAQGQEIPGVSNDRLGSILGTLGSHGRAESKGGTGLSLGPRNGLDGETGGRKAREDARGEDRG